MESGKMTERTITKKSWTDNDSDSISITSTKESEVDEDATYVVDCILAEEDDDEGKLYLIRWEGYPLLQSTWEPAENIQMHETFDKWEVQKDRIRRGEAQPFDILDFNNQLRELITAREERHKRRRAKRKRLGIPQSPSSSDSEDSVGATSRIVPKSGDEATEYRQEREDHSDLPSPAERSAPIPRSRQNSQDDSDISENSLLEELVQKVLKRPGLGVQKKTGKLEQERHSAKVSRIFDSPSYSDTSPPRAARDVEAEKPRRRGENVSRTGYKGTANRGTTVSGTVPRGRGSAATRGSTRGSTQVRGHGANTGNVNFTGIKSTAEGAAKQRRSLTNSILKAPKSSTNGQKDHFKTIHMVRKAELGGRALADRAPDVEDVGPLRTPSEYVGPRPVRIKPQEAVIEGLRKNSKSEQRGLNPSSPMDFNITRSLTGQKMMDDEDNQIVLHDGPDNFAGVAENAKKSNEPGGYRSSTGTESQKQPPSTTQLENRPVNAIVHTHSQLSDSDPSKLMEFNSPGDLPVRAPTSPRALVQGHNQKINRRNESSNSGLVAQPVEKPLPEASIETLSGPRPRTPSKGVVVTGQGLPSKSVTKMRLSEYKSRRVSDIFGNAISVQAIFGVKSTQLLPIAFAETNKFFDHPWILALRDTKNLGFTKALTAQDLEPQAEILQGSFLARGNVITDANGILALKEVAENLRPCLGLLFQHSSFNILIFPGRCEEWKFLEGPNTDQNAVLRYHIYSQPCAVAINSPSPTVLSINERLSSLVELSHSLSYKSLVPRCKDGQDAQNFYLLFPGKETDTENFLAAWLRACNGECRIFVHRKSGSWRVFCSRSRVKSGAVIIHPSLVPLVSKIHGIERLLSGRSSFYFWCFDDGSLQSLHSSPSSGVKMVRLFPHGGAVMLTPGFLFTQPQRTYEFFVWFRSKVAIATPGTWKTVLPYDCRQLLLDLAIQKKAEGVEMNIYKFWFLSHQILDNLMGEEFMEDFPNCWSSDAPYEGECSIVYADQSIKSDDEISLASWYAGWTMLHLNTFRKFIIVGTKPDNNTLHALERKSFTTRSGADGPEETYLGTSVPAKDDTLRNDALKSSSGKWKRNVFAVTKDTSSNAELEPSSPTQITPSHDARTQELRTGNGRKQRGNLEGVSDETSDMTSSSRPSHGIDETLNKSILEFIAITGANREEAERLLNKHDSDIDIAARNYLSSAKLTSSPPSFPKLDGTQNSDPNTLLDFQLSSDAMKSVVFQSLHLALDDVKRAKDLYRAAHDPSGSPSRGLANNDEADANEDLPGKPSTIAPGVMTDEMSKHISIPRSVRVSGSVRSGINIRTSYVPPEDRPVYENRRVGGIPQHEVGENTSTEAGSTNSSSRQTPVGTEAEQESAESSGPPRNPTIAYTTEWYSKFKKTHEAWEHIYVGPWDECFKILKVKNKA